MVVRCHEPKLDGLVTAAVTGAPSEGIEVSIWPGTKSTKTDADGSFSGTFTAPSGGLLGCFWISVEDKGSTTIRVEEYKRPMFFAELMPPSAPAALGARVTLNGKAEAYTGAVIDGATVTWRVTHITDLPSWIHWSE